MSARPVAQGAITTDFEAKDDDRFRLTTWGSMSLTASNGDAAFTTSEALDLDESRVIADYTHAFDHRLLQNFHAGVVSYNYSNSPFFQATKELYAGTHWDWKNFTPAFTLFWDIDGREGLYLKSAISSDFEFNDEIPGYWKVSLGFGSPHFNKSTYGDKDAGFADLTAEVGGTKEINKNTTARAFASLSHLFVDDNQLDALSIETTNFWIGGGLNWSF